MKKDLYLIRVAFQTFVGPLDLDGVRRAHKNMEFGLQDEIAGSNRKWVRFDDMDKIRKYYPELTRFVGKELLSGWGLTEEIKEIKSSPSKSVQEKSSAKNAAFFVVMACIFIAIGAITFKKAPFLLDQFGALKDPSPTRAIEFYNNGNKKMFNTYIKTHLKGILMSGNPQYWTPILRIYAYRHEGAIEGIIPLALKGKGADYAVNDCSTAYFQKSLKAIGGKVLQVSSGMGKGIADTDISKMLLWNPHWIKRRIVPEAWIEPQSYYEACLAMAAKAVVRHATLSKREQSYTLLKNRLSWVLALASGINAKDKFIMKGPLWALSCIEQAESEAEISECVTVRYQKEWRSLLEFRSNHRRVWLTINQNKLLGPQDIAYIADTIKSLSPLEPSTKMDYGVELRFFQELLTNGGLVQEAKKTALLRYPTINNLD